MDRYRTLRWIAYISEIMILYILQNAPGLLAEILGARPVLLISAALSIAMFEGELAGIGVGVIAGLLIDFSGGGVLGFHVIVLVVLCYLIGLLTMNLIRTNLLTALALSGLAIPLVFLMHWIFYYVIWGYGSEAYVLVTHILPRTLYTFLAVPVLYYFNRAIAHRLREPV